MLVDGDKGWGKGGLRMHGCLMHFPSLLFLAVLGVMGTRRSSRTLGWREASMEFSHFCRWYDRLMSVACSSETIAVGVGGWFKERAGYFVQASYDVVLDFFFFFLWELLCW